MNQVPQVLSVLCWLIIALAILPMIWLILQPYLKGWSHAERRAVGLLRDLLTPEQWRQLIWQGYLEIASPTKPQRIYRVPRTKGYVQVIENGHAVMRLCLQPIERLPDADIVVLHKLMIEANEETYLQQANKYFRLDQVN
jgi:hypothetical protein